MMRIILLLILTLTPGELFTGERMPVAEKGILDLRNIRNPEDFQLKLVGEWEFYWKKMLRPHDFRTANVNPDHYGTVPSYWTDYPEQIGITRHGYATYRLNVILPAGFRDALGIDLPVFDSSYDIYIDGKYIGGNGVPGRTAAETVPEYSRVFSRVQPVNDTLEIIINVSNFHHRRGGFWLPVKLGTFETVRRQMANSWAADWAIISLLMGFSLLFLFFFIVSSQEKITIYYSIFAFGLAMRPLFTDHFLISSFIDTPWSWLVRCEYLTTNIAVFGLAWFTQHSYPGRLIKSFVIALTAILLFVCVFILLAPVTQFSFTTFIILPALIILLVYLLIKSIIAAFGKKRLEIFHVGIFTLILAGGIHDIQVSFGKSSHTGYILTYVFSLVVFLQALLLLYKWIKAFQEKEKLRFELEFMNRNLEMLIDERTSELKKRTGEIEQQNQKIANQNKVLSDTIQLKNRIFSVIAHDLRSPVVNILYMLNLLREKEYREEYESFTNMSIDYAQRVIGLLENMLVWGRGQEDKIKFSPAHHDLADVILTNLSIFKETADKKEISINFTHVGSPVALCDRDLLDIIIRNLLSNAVKYTARKGRISIFLKHRKNIGGGIMIKICDNGCGMTEETQKNIFTSEEIVSTPGTENERGTGLGLKLCHELVKLNNGTIAVESVLNEGTCFIITLPN